MKREYVQRNGHLATWQPLVKFGVISKDLNVLEGSLHSQLCSRVQFIV